MSEEVPVFDELDVGRMVEVLAKAADKFIEGTTPEAKLLLAKCELAAKVGKFTLRRTHVRPSG